MREARPGRSRCRGRRSRLQPRFWVCTRAAGGSVAINPATCPQAAGRAACPAGLPAYGGYPHRLARFGVRRTRHPWLGAADRPRPCGRLVSKPRSHRPFGKPAPWAARPDPLPAAPRLHCRGLGRPQTACPAKPGAYGDRDERSALVIPRYRDRRERDMAGGRPASAARERRRSRQQPCAETNGDRG